MQLQPLEIQFISLEELVWPLAIQFIPLET